MILVPRTQGFPWHTSFRTEIRESAFIHRFFGVRTMFPLIAERPAGTRARKGNPTL